MTWVIVFIFLGAVTLVYFDVRSIRANAKRIAALNAWPAFVEFYVSALQSGISVSDAFSFVDEFKLKGLEQPLGQLEKDLNGANSLEGALRKFKKTLAHNHSDAFCEIIILGSNSGSGNLIHTLQEHAKLVRANLMAMGAATARNSAIISVAKLGLLAPWILVGVLSVNQQNRTAFASDAGSLLLFLGFAVSVIAYRLILLAAKPVSAARVLVGSNG